MQKVLESNYKKVELSRQDFFSSENIKLARQQVGRDLT